MDELKKIGRYEVQSPIGRGGFATVYLGRDPYINRFVALKVSEAGENAAQNPALVKLFQEAEAAGALIHPNIVTIFDVGIQNPICYIAMEYVEGHTLHRHCTKAELLPIADALDIVIKICHGLDYAHQRGVIHRDIKPGNILLGTHGEIKIADFGLACFKELSTQERRTVGTPSYMPPEQVEGRGSAPQSDIFSLGVILYQLLCGSKPFEANDSLEMRRKILREPHTPLKDHASELPPKLFSIVDRMLEKKAEDRYQSGMDVARDLENVLHSPGEIIDGALIEHIKYLRTLAFFEDFSDKEIANTLLIGTWLDHKENEVIFGEDEPGDGFYVLAHGEAKVSKAGKDVRKLSRGDCFGELSFLLQRSRTATVKATTECGLLRLNPEKISILDKDTQIKLYRLFAKTLANYLLWSEEKK